MPYSLHANNSRMNKRKFEEIEAECTDTDSTEYDNDDDCVQLDEGDNGKKKEPDTTEEAPKKKFRINAKQLALTYSRCPISKQEVYSQLHQKLGAPTEYLVVQEDHKVMSIQDKRAVMRQNYDQLNARCNALELLMTKIKRS